MNISSACPYTVGSGGLLMLGEDWTRPSNKETGKTKGKKKMYLPVEELRKKMCLPVKE